MLSYSNKPYPKLPIDAFEEIGKWIPNINSANLKTEYSLFIQS